MMEPSRDTGTTRFHDEHLGASGEEGGTDSLYLDEIKLPHSVRRGKCKERSIDREREGGKKSRKGYRCNPGR